MKHIEQHNQKITGRLNSLRAAVLGANDGIVSIAGLVVGVAGATTSRAAILTAGVAGVVAGAISMAAGEFVSVSSQRDSEKALLRKEHFELTNNPEAEQEELVEIYRAKGLSRTTAQQVAQELTEHDAFAAHAEAELKLDPNDLNNPWQAAIASALAFLAGAVIPLLAVVISPTKLRVPITFIAVLCALVVTGMLSAHYGGANKVRATIRVVSGGALAMIVTYAIGFFIGTQNI